MIKKYKQLDQKTIRDQKVRRFRLGLACLTYAVVLLVIFLITIIGIGRMNVYQWALCIGVPILGNIVFSFFFIQISTYDLANLP